MRHILWLTLTFFGFSAPMAFSAPPPATVKASFKMMNVEELSQAMKEGKVFVYDSNSNEMYKDGHIPGAQHMTFDKVSADKLPKEKNAKLVFYCANERCTASHDAARKAIELGYDNVWVMSPGIMGWKKAGKPTEK